MVVKWNKDAQIRIREIFDYYYDVVGQKTAMKITSTLRDSVDSLGRMPLKAPIELSLEDEPEKYRSLVILRRYKAVYYVEDETVIVVDIWDCRQSPAKLKTRVTESVEV